MGFWSTLKEKFTGKKAEQTSTVLPTLQDIDKQNNELNNMETKTVESIINAPIETPPAQDNVMPSMGPSPEGLPMPTVEQSASSAVKPAKAIRKSAPKKRKAAKKKAVKKAAPKRKAPSKKKAVKKAAPKKAKKASPKKKAVKKASKKKRR